MASLRIVDKVMSLRFLLFSLLVCMCVCSTFTLEKDFGKNLKSFTPVVSWTLGSTDCYSYRSTSPKVTRQSKRLVTQFAKPHLALLVVLGPMGPRYVLVFVFSSSRNCYLLNCVLIHRFGDLRCVTYRKFCSGNLAIAWCLEKMTSQFDSLNGSRRRSFW